MSKTVLEVHGFILMKNEPKMIVIPSIADSLSASVLVQLELAWHNAQKSTTSLHGAFYADGTGCHRCDYCDNSHDIGGESSQAQTSTHCRATSRGCQVSGPSSHASTLRPLTFGQ
jgi:hypothetical protein